MCVKNLLQVFIFSLILKSTFLNVTDVSTNNSELEVSDSTIEVETNSISDHLTTEQIRQEGEVNRSFDRPKCNVSSDCPDSQMLCTSNKTCRCPTFHFWNSTNKLCSVNLTDLLLWFQHSISNESETVSQSAEFSIDDSGPYKILTAKWNYFPRSKQEEIGQHIYGVIWPIMLGFFIIAVLYAAIILNYL